jgi:hypothetical protein
MGKTHRFSSEADDIGFQDHRIHRQDIIHIHREMARYVNMDVPRIRKTAKVISLLPKDWIPAHSESISLEHIRDIRLDLLHFFGETVIQAAQQA